MNHLTIDIETFSCADLGKVGVYKYALDPSFELLLFGYSIDGGEVRTIDVAMGEKIPEEIIDALFDEKIIKSAFNAMFERVCLSSYLRSKGKLDNFLSPRGWHCDMVWAGYLGYPMSLKGVGEVLGLDKQKLEEGKSLIKKFCVPVKGTTSRFSSLVSSFDSIEDGDWELFKKYNIRDVETEMGIAKELSDYPVPDIVWEEYWLDQEINDRGILVDLDMIEGALKIDAQAQKTISEQIQKLTGIENPRSVMQMKKWLSDNGIEMPTLNRKELTKVIEEVKEPQKSILKLWQKLAMSAVKKYTAMDNAVCDDGRLRGMFKFYGANRTGRFCLAEGTPVLVMTPEDLIIEKPIEEVEDTDLVYDGKNWVTHDGVIYSGDNEVITWDGITASPEHIIWIDNKTKMTLSEAERQCFRLWSPCVFLPCMRGTEHHQTRL